MTAMCGRDPGEMRNQEQGDLQVACQSSNPTLQRTLSLRAGEHYRGKVAHSTLLSNTFFSRQVSFLFQLNLKRDHRGL